MTASSRRTSANLQFTLGLLFYAITLVALFYALRRCYLMTAFDLANVIERARNVPTLQTLAAAVLATTIPRVIPGKGLWPIVRGAILGVAVGLLSSLALAVEFGEGVRRMSPEYWNWWRDWPRVAPYVTVATIQCGALAATILQIAQFWRNLKVRPMPRSHHLPQILSPPRCR